MRLMNPQPLHLANLRFASSSHQCQQTSATVVDLGVLEGLSPFKPVSSHDDVPVTSSIAKPIERFTGAEVDRSTLRIVSKVLHWYSQ